MRGENACIPCDLGHRHVLLLSKLLTKTFDNSRSLGSNTTGGSKDQGIEIPMLDLKNPLFVHAVLLALTLHEESPQGTG